MVLSNIQINWQHSSPSKHHLKWSVLWWFVLWGVIGMDTCVKIVLPALFPFVNELDKHPLEGLVLLSSFSCCSSDRSHTYQPTEKQWITSSFNLGGTQLTSWLTSLATPGHMNLSVTQERVLFVPKCPDVGSLWHSFRIFTCSSLLRIKRTCT